MTRIKKTERVGVGDDRATGCGADERGVGMRERERGEAEQAEEGVGERERERERRAIWRRRHQS